MDDSELEERLNAVQISNERHLDFSQINLSKKIPKLTLINVIITEYPDLCQTADGIYVVTEDILFELVKRGADSLIQLQDDMILKLVNALELQDMMNERCEMKIKDNKNDVTADDDQDDKVGIEDDEDIGLGQSQNRDVSLPPILKKGEESKANTGDVKESRTKPTPVPGSKKKVVNIMRHKTILRTFKDNDDDEIGLGNDKK